MERIRASSASSRVGKLVRSTSSIFRTEKQVLGEGVVVAIADTAHRGADAGVVQPLP